jgi:hypothetical protein
MYRNLPRATRPFSFKVSDAVRRRKVGGARTRGPHAVIYGDFDGEPTGATAEGADKRTDVRADGRFVGRRCGCLEADGLQAEGRSPLLRGTGADCSVPRGVAAAGMSIDMPCRVTTQGSRIG